MLDRLDRLAALLDMLDWRGLPRRHVRRDGRRNFFVYC
jgi:hypothetical protein